MNNCPNTDTFLLSLIPGAWMQCDSFRFETEVRSCWQLYLVLLSIWIAIARATPQGNSFNKIFSFRKGNAKTWLEYVIVLLSKRIYIVMVLCTKCIFRCARDKWIERVRESQMYRTGRRERVIRYSKIYYLFPGDSMNEISNRQFV